MIALKLAWRNLVGAGLRTWLNVAVLSFSFVVIIWHRGFLEGWNQQARRDTINWEIGGGQLWHAEYDPYDLFALSDSHGTLPEVLVKRVDDGSLTPVLITQGSIYPEGRIQSVLLKGIDPDQSILKIPSPNLAVKPDQVGRGEIPALIGTRMATNTKLNTGDQVTLRWRDVNGAFDAAEVRIVGLFKTAVPTVDSGQLWIPLERLREMTGMPGEATLLVTASGSDPPLPLDGWTFQDHGVLLAEMDQIIKQKTIGGSILYLILLSLAMLAIFNTQVLSVFRRQKEIGTIMALGMTRGQVVRIFTIEGGMHAVFAAAVSAVYGIPLLTLQAVKGFSMPEATDGYGLAIAEKIFPVYSAGLVLGTTALVLAAATIVSFIPARRIARMEPTEALRGKLQ